MKTVEANRPKINDQANPEKIGSRAMGTALSMAVPVVSRIGLSRTTRDSMMASYRLRPRRNDSRMKSTRMIESRVTIPDRAIMPIIPVAVKKIGSGYPPRSPPVMTFSSQKPGMIPTTVNGMASMTTTGRANDPVSLSSRM